MRQSTMKNLACVVISGFAGLSCITNLMASDEYLMLNPAGTHPCPFEDSDCPPLCLEPGYCGPCMYFGAEYLFWTRNSNVSSNLVIGGPDAFSYHDLGFGFEGGYRLRAAVAFEFLEFEFSWAEIDGWNSSRGGQLTNGVGFDGGAAFAGANFINQGTFFQSIHHASTIDAGGVNMTFEDHGLGPAGGFDDLPPVYNMEYRSTLRDLELMAKYAPFHERVKLGVGWRRVTLDELAGVSMTGTFRAVDNDPAAPGGLSHAALTSPQGGNLMHLGGAADGFDDETGLLGGVGPDTLLLRNMATTDNTLNGVQFSMEALLIEGERFLIDSSIKAGIYQNRATGRVIETYSGIANDDSVYGRSLTSNSSNVALVAQLGLGTTYRVNDYIRFRFGWEVLFLSGVALAPDQAAQPLSNSYQINNDGSLIANGGHVGLEFTY